MTGRLGSRSGSSVSGTWRLGRAVGTDARRTPGAQSGKSRHNLWRRRQLPWDWFLSDSSRRRSLGVRGRDGAGPVGSDDGWLQDRAGWGRDPDALALCSQAEPGRMAGADKYRYSDGGAWAQLATAQGRSAQDDPAIWHPPSQSPAAGRFKSGECLFAGNPPRPARAACHLVRGPCLPEAAISFLSLLALPAALFLLFSSRYRPSRGR